MCMAIGGLPAVLCPPGIVLWLVSAIGEIPPLVNVVVPACVYSAPSSLSC